MKYGMHNALTAYPLYGWQKYFSWLINPFSKCQSRTMRLAPRETDFFDIQVALKDGKWRGSHGFAWYDATIDDVVETAKMLYAFVGTVTYIRLGYDHHFSIKQDLSKFAQLFLYLKAMPCINIYELYIEDKNGKVITIFHPAYDISIFERYWSLSWAKSQVKKHWWKFYLLLPLPHLWAKHYKKEWLEEFKNSGKEIFMTDFV